MQSPSRNFLSLIAAWASVNARQYNRENAALQDSKLSVYIDESGDLGRGDGGTKYFVVSSIETVNGNCLSHAVKRVKARRGLSLAEEYKGNWWKLMKVRSDILSELRALDIQIKSLVVKKEGVPVDILSKQHDLYYHIICQLLSQYLVYNNDVLVNIHRRTLMYSLRDYPEFESYKDYYATGIKVIQRSSESCYGIQAADAVANATLRLFERDDRKLYGLIAGKVIQNNRLFA